MEGLSRARISIEDGALVVRPSAFMTYGPRAMAVYGVVMIPVLGVFGAPPIDAFLFDDLFFGIVMVPIFILVGVVGSLQTSQPLVKVDASGILMPANFGARLHRVEVPWGDVIAIEVVNNAPVWNNRARLCVVRHSTRPAWVAITPKARWAMDDNRRVAHALAQWPTRWGWPPLPVHESESTFFDRLGQI